MKEIEPGQDDFENDFQEYAKFRHENRDRKLVLRQRLLDRVSSERRRERQLRWRWVSKVAAMLMICSTIGLMIWFRATDSTDLKEGLPMDLSVALAQHIQPGQHKARLKLDDGTAIVLDPSSEGIILADQLFYTDGAAVNGESAWKKSRFMTLETPLGGQYKIVLPDQTVVHLNAGTTLKYPLAFERDGRKVYLSGEAYFDVFHDPDRPFVVKTARNEVEVLGTEFNLSDYSDEAHTVVTLVEGSVKVKDLLQRAHLLTPNSQSISDGDGFNIVAVDVDDFIAWRSGQFAFNKEALGPAMKRIGRWYDLDIVVHESAQDIKIWGSLDRYDTFDKVLEVLELLDKDLIVTINNRRVEIMK